MYKRRRHELYSFCGGLGFFRPGQVSSVYGCFSNLHGVVRMASWLIAGVGIVYLVIAVDLLIRGNWGLGIAFLGYCLGNVGLYLEAR
jgi:hypothetical protein